MTAEINVAIRQLAVDLLSELRGYSTHEIEDAVIAGDDAFDPDVVTDLLRIESVLRRVRGLP